MQRAAAVQWSRGAGGEILLTAVRDFGVQPLSAAAKRFFAANMNPNTHLPAVEPQSWEVNRYSLRNPIDPPMQPAEVCAWIANQHNVDVLYDNLPVMVILGQDLQVSLRNLPDYPQPPLQDFVLNLAAVVHIMALTIRHA